MGLKESTPKGLSSDVYRRDREVPAQGRLTCLWLPRIKSDFSLECIYPAGEVLPFDFYPILSH